MRLVLAFCIMAAMPPALAAEAVPPDLVGEWSAEQIGSLAPDEFDSTLKFAAEGRASGKGGCNNWFSTTTFDGASLTFGGIGSTKMACAALVATEQERQFFVALEAVRSWGIVEDKLVLSGTDGQALVTFARSAP